MYVVERDACFCCCPNANRSVLVCSKCRRTFWPIYNLTLQIHFNTVLHFKKCCNSNRIAQVPRASAIYLEARMRLLGTRTTSRKPSNCTSTEPSRYVFKTKATEKCLLLDLYFARTL